ncbi:unnamed protein product, partial [Rotaria sp. Silwood1]
MDYVVNDEHLVTLNEDHEAKSERKAKRKKSKMESQLSYPSDEREAALDEEQPDEHQRQRVEIMKDGRVAIDQQMSERYQVLGNMVVDEIQQVLNELNKVDTYFSPIIGYAEEPLLPLSEVCAPLADILHNLSFYMQLALDETPENPPDGLTIDESAAVRLYTIEWERPHRSLYSMLNYTLKGGDFNRDGELDWAVINQDDNTVSVALGYGNATFENLQTYNVGATPVSMVYQDFNKDDKVDLVVVNYGDNSISVLLGNGDGTFQAQITYEVGMSPSAVVAADFNNDSKMDLALTFSNESSIGVSYGNGDGSFQRPVRYKVGTAPSAMRADDFNDDGRIDLVVANSGEHTFSMLINGVDGTFQDQIKYATGANPVAITSADYDNDKIIDVLVVNKGDNSVSLLL